MEIRALLPSTIFRRRLPTFGPETISGVVLLATNLIGCALAGSTIVHEVLGAHETGAVSVPDQDAEVQSLATNATAVLDPTGPTVRGAAV